jgi:ribosomal protein S24E
LEYHAGLVPESEAEERSIGLPIIEVPAGLCVRRKLENWTEHTDQIGVMFDEMIREFGMDRSRPTMEYYRSVEEMHLLVPIEKRR